MTSRIQVRAEYARRLVESWKKDHDDAMRVFDLEDAIATCLTVPPLARACSKALFDDLFALRVKDTETLGRDFLTQVDETLATFRTIQNLAKAATQCDRATGSLLRLEDAICSLEQIRTHFKENWPFIDLTTVEASRKDLAAGKYQTLEQVLDELQAEHPQ